MTNWDYRLDPPDDPPEEEFPMLGEDDMSPGDYFRDLFDEEYLKDFEDYLDEEERE